MSGDDNLYLQKKVNIIMTISYILKIYSLHRVLKTSNFKKIILIYFELKKKNFNKFRKK